MSEAEDRKARSARVQQSLEQYLADIGETEMLGDWVVIACTVSVDSDGDPRARYLMLFSGGSMLDHHALGLLGKAEEMLTDGSVREGDDDDDE